MKEMTNAIQRINFTIKYPVSISLIAKAVGNSVLVCEKYYLGYALQEEGIQMIHQGSSPVDESANPTKKGVVNKFNGDSVA